MVDLIEAGRDVRIDHPLIGAAGEEVDLGDRVLRPSPGPEAIRARREVRLEDRLEHELERSLHHPVPDGRDAQPATLAAGLGDHPLANRDRAERAGTKIGPQLGEERCLAALGFDRIGRLAVDPCRACAPVAPHPAPCNEQERRVSNEVEEVGEPTRRIVDRPSVQLGLHPQYPPLRLTRRRPRRAGVHRRPPAPQSPILRDRCPPSPCGRLSRPPTTPRTPPQPEAIS